MKKLTNFLYYLYKRNNWMLGFSFYFKNFENIKIDRPIFLLGVQGGGLTLVSRMLRKNKKVVSVTGNYHYWYGADEMQNVLWPILPVELAGVKYKYPAKDKFIVPRGSLYAIDKLIKYYRKTEQDATEELKRKFQKIIRWTISRHTNKKEKIRFTDKSQVYTVKASFINELLKKSNPKFILITRNPYALCYRAVARKGFVPEFDKVTREYGFNKSLDFIAQHWKNSIKYSLIDKRKIKNFLTVRFEDVLREPEENLKKICKFTELKYIPDMIPRSFHKIGLGTRSLGDKKWYPIRKDVNGKYLQEIKKEHITIINRQVKKYAEKLNYKKPK